jgi:hypothetical protein
MRSYHKSWQDRRPGFTRRVRWYEGTTASGKPSIRLNMESMGEVWNEFFSDRDEATRVYEAFIADGHMRFVRSRRVL